MNRDERWKLCEAMLRCYDFVHRQRVFGAHGAHGAQASGDRHGQLGAPFPAGRALTRVRRFVASTWPVGSMTFALGPRGLSDDVSTKRCKTSLVVCEFQVLFDPNSLRRFGASCP